MEELFWSLDFLDCLEKTLEYTLLSLFNLCLEKIRLTPICNLICLLTLERVVALTLEEEKKLIGTVILYN